MAYKAISFMICISMHDMTFNVFEMGTEEAVYNAFQVLVIEERAYAFCVLSILWNETDK